MFCRVNSGPCCNFMQNVDVLFCKESTQMGPAPSAALSLFYGPRISAQVSERGGWESHTRAGWGLTGPGHVSGLDGGSVPPSLGPRSVPLPRTPSPGAVWGWTFVQIPVQPHGSPLSWVFLTPGWLGDEPEGLAGSSGIWGPRQASDRPPEATCAPSSGRLT